MRGDMLKGDGIIALVMLQMVIPYTNISTTRRIRFIVRHQNLTQVVYVEWGGIGSGMWCNGAHHAAKPEYRL